MVDCERVKRVLNLCFLIDLDDVYTIFLFVIFWMVIVGNN